MEYLLHFGFTSDRLSPMELRDLNPLDGQGRRSLPFAGRRAGADLRRRFGANGQLLIDPVRLQAARGDARRRVRGGCAGGTELIGGGYLETATPAPSSCRAQDRRAIRHSRSPRPGDHHARGACRCASATFATVLDGPAPRIGDAMIGGRPGILVETSTQFGANTLEVSYALEKRLATLAPALAAQGCASTIRRS